MFVLKVVKVFRMLYSFLDNRKKIILILCRLIIRDRWIDYEQSFISDIVAYPPRQFYATYKKASKVSIDELKI